MAGVDFFNDDGAGSTMGSAHGWQRKIRFNAKYDPRKGPCMFNASFAYCEQLGKWRQFAPNNGDRQN
jgi:hypothetical protein